MFALMICVHICGDKQTSVLCWFVATFVRACVRSGLTRYIFSLLYGTGHAGDTKDIINIHSTMI